MLAKNLSFTAWLSKVDHQPLRRRLPNHLVNLLPGAQPTWVWRVVREGQVEEPPPWQLCLHTILLEECISRAAIPTPTEGMTRDSRECEEKEARVPHPHSPH